MNKKICQHCCNQYFPPWRVEDDLLWKKETVLCRLDDVREFRGALPNSYQFHASIHKREENAPVWLPPHWCKYTLEHTVMVEESAATE